ncbi:MAG: acyl-CoA transferase/carnitine dehydratase-like protein [Frankiales bacterium]|nr:acyl-CoA transferase/carnitine dehydratase-like protein [Frankiales bacterium]
MADGPLAGWGLAPVPPDPASGYAADLLRALGAQEHGFELVVQPSPGSGAENDWADSGAMALTGASAGPPLPAPGCPATAARAALLAMQALGGPPVLGHHLLGERAALLGFSRNAPWSVGGSCRGVRSSDGWVAVSLARPDDREAVPALVGRSPHGDAWDQLDQWAGSVTAQEVAERAQLLGIPASPVPSQPVRRWPPWQIASAAGDRCSEKPLVVDLSSLWAGPLCGSLLGLSGAEVIRVESTRRPDGGRQHPAFDDLLHAGQPSVALDFQHPQGRADLQRLVASADVVITSARTRALRALGLIPGGLSVWVSITAHPPRPDGSEWVGFGDDAAMAAGLVHWDQQGRPVPCGDAVADPLTGAHAALAALACLRAGGRHHVRLNLRDVAASTLVRADGDEAPGGAHPPRARRSTGTARPLGADTQAVLGAR